jgi:inhibitor of KinA
VSDIGVESAAGARGRFRIVAAGDAAVIVELDDRIDADVNDRAIGLAARLRDTHADGVLDVVPTFRSVGVYFDPLRTNQAHLIETLTTIASAPQSPLHVRTDVTTVDVCYGAEYGPDLPDVAARVGMSESEVVDLHTVGVYRVFMLGFMPGFAYMGTLPERLQLPRHAVPRTKVPAGSVAIAAQLTGIYPFETPGGWHVIGRTRLSLVDFERAHPCLFRPGDSVRFQSIDRARFASIAPSSGPSSRA